jgi:hypothetical protein
MNLIFHFILLFSVNADLPSVISSGFKFDLAFDQRKNSVIFAEANVISRMNSSAALADNNRPCQYFFSIVSFNAQSLTGAIPAVTRAAAALFMSHLNHLS